MGLHKQKKQKNGTKMARKAERQPGKQKNFEKQKLHSQGKIRRKLDRAGRGNYNQSKHKPASQTPAAGWGTYIFNIRTSGRMIGREL